MQINQEKLTRQLEGRDKWESAGFMGLLLYATGVGKTYTSTLCIRRAEELFKESYIVLLENEALVKQWKSVLNKELPKYINDKILILSAQTVINNKTKYETGTLIVDEIHKFTTDNRLNLLVSGKIFYKRFLGLTATPDGQQFWKIKKFFPIVDIITEEEAREKKFIADFVEYNLALTLNKMEAERNEHYSKIVSDLMPRFNNNIGIAHKIIVGGKDDHGIHYSGPGWAMGLATARGWSNNMDMTKQENQELDQMYNPNRLISYAQSLTTAVRKRKEILCNCQSKLMTSIELVKKFDKVKTIIFSESTIFTDTLGKMLLDAKQPVVTYHSQLTTVMRTSESSGKFLKFGKVRLKREALENIKSGKARILNTARSLDAGVDIPDLRFGLTTSGSQSPDQYKQRKGRPTRKEDILLFDDVPVLLVNLYIEGTQDEVWLKGRQKTSSNVPITVRSVEEITFFPLSNEEFIDKLL